MPRWSSLLALALAILASTPKSSPAAESPVFSELSLVVSCGRTWFVPVGTSLYASDDGRTWRLAATAPDRIRFLVTDGTRVAAAGRNWVLTFTPTPDSPAPQPVSLEADVTALALLPGGWIAGDAGGGVWVSTSAGS